MEIASSMEQAHSGAGAAVKRNRHALGRRPPPVQGRTGHPRRADPREAADAAQCISVTGRQRRALPSGFQLRSTDRRRFRGWRLDRADADAESSPGVARKGAGRKPEPTAGVIDSRSVKTAESGGPSGCDGGRKTKGRKRRAVADVDGLPTAMKVHPAGVQDRGGAPEAIEAVLKQARPWRGLSRTAVARGRSCRRGSGRRASRKT